MTSKSTIFLSIVSPVYRADATVEELVRRLVKALEPISPQFEIILVDDRSPDDSWQQIQAQATRDPRVRGLRLSRNFGQHRAILAGLEQCQGEWIVVMDCDLQDQPEEIPQLLAQAQTGFDLVLARRVERQDSWVRRYYSALFYWLLSYLTGTAQDPAIANFGVYHRKVIAAVLAMRESASYFPLMVRWVGFRRLDVPVAHASRGGGSSSYSFSRMSNLALDIILAYSDKPLRLTVKLGLVVSGTTFVMILVMLFRFLNGQIVVLGYTSLILSIWFFSGLVLSVLGMVGLYLGKTFEQVKNRPLYLVDEVSK
ncbi:glycosyltransferase family 2 protein [Hymenobacter rubidus]|uniref:glycosyltransferase family 2 protein n=1 Tax=Hymenobacter rubidus TaxID=1441626 RepID=UPI00191DD79A|nr:glycosyltransferase family 2 protein [Hymenobacter rubidus]